MAPSWGTCRAHTQPFHTCATLPCILTPYTTITLKMLVIWLTSQGVDIGCTSLESQALSEQLTYLYLASTGTESGRG